MPQMGESIFEGTITKWLKKAGDRVEKDEPLFEISTDKVDAEIASPVAGVLAEIKVAEGVTVEVDTVVAVIDEAVSAATEKPSVEQSPQVKGTGFSPYIVTTKSTDASTHEGKVSAITSDAAGRAPRTSPLVRRIAKENNLDLSQIAGSGSEGRITKDDVLRHLSERGTGNGVAQALPTSPQPMTRMRAIIAQRMVESVQISPHVHTVYKIDMTRIARLRERERDRFAQQHGVKLTYMPFIATAVVAALGKYPIVNASLIDGLIHYHAQINLGIAVALEWGLIVPVVRQAESLSFPVLARAIADLAERARTKKLLPDEVQGGSFTLTNSGVFGDEFGTPIINQPESAILAIGSLRKEPVVLTDAEGNDTIAIRSMQHFCLGFDHRTIDGADAGRFMSEFKRALETWERPI
jgi:2-oxoglutarate dehydrogenase E2 component (dihydrolipoamide succinyltransferase)